MSRELQAVPRKLVDLLCNAGSQTSGSIQRFEEVPESLPPPHAEVALIFPIGTLSLLCDLPMDKKA